MICLYLISSQQLLPPTASQLGVPLHTTVVVDSLLILPGIKWRFTMPVAIWGAGGMPSVEGLLVSIKWNSGATPGSVIAWTKVRTLPVEWRGETWWPPLVRAWCI